MDKNVKEALKTFILSIISAVVAFATVCIKDCSGLNSTKVVTTQVVEYVYS